MCHVIHPLIAFLPLTHKYTVHFPMLRTHTSALDKAYMLPFWFKLDHHANTEQIQVHAIKVIYSSREFHKMVYFDLSHVICNQWFYHIIILDSYIILCHIMLLPLFFGVKFLVGLEGVGWFCEPMHLIFLPWFVMKAILNMWLKSWLYEEPFYQNKKKVILCITSEHMQNW